MSVKISRPDYLGAEDIVILRGPSWLDALLRMAKGPSAAARDLGLSRMTFHRLAAHDPFSRKVPSYRSAWPGYPDPLPALDAVAEKLSKNTTAGILSLLDEEQASACARGDAELGFATLGVAADEVKLAAARAQVPNWKALMACPWPAGLQALDLLASQLTGERWIDLVVSREPPENTRLPPEAVASLLGSHFYA